MVLGELKRRPGREPPSDCNPPVRFGAEKPVSNRHPTPNITGLASSGPGWSAPKTLNLSLPGVNPRRYDFRNPKPLYDATECCRFGGAPLARALRSVSWVGGRGPAGPPVPKHLFHVGRRAEGNQHLIVVGAGAEAAGIPDPEDTVPFHDMFPGEAPPPVARSGRMWLRLRRGEDAHRMFAVA